MNQNCKVKLNCTICNKDMEEPCLVFRDLHDTYQMMCWNCSMVIQTAIDGCQKANDDFEESKWDVPMDEIGSDFMEGNQ